MSKGSKDEPADFPSPPEPSVEERPEIYAIRRAAHGLHPGRRLFLVELGVGALGASCTRGQAPRPARVAPAAAPPVVPWKNVEKLSAPACPGTGEGAARAKTIFRLAASPDGSILAASDDSRSTRLWKLPEDEPWRVLDRYTGAWTPLAFSPDGKLLATASESGSLALWSIPEGALLSTWKTAHEGGASGLGFGPDSRVLVSGGRLVAVSKAPGATSNCQPTALVGGPMSKPRRTPRLTTVILALALSCSRSAATPGGDAGAAPEPEVGASLDADADVGAGDDAAAEASPPVALPTHGLTLVNGVVQDSNQNVYWLAEANLAATPEGQAIWAQMNNPAAGLDLSGINPNGTMDFPTARSWVQALNQVSWNGCQGYLCHTDWQLPVTPNEDATCSEQGPAPYSNDFAAWCTGSALGNLYGVGLGLRFSSSVVPGFTNTVGPFANLHPSLYWTADSNGGNGERTFSFLTGLAGSNTTKYNYFYLLPRLAGAPANSPVPSGSGVLAYTDGPAAGKAVYDTHTQVTWVLDGDLAASQPFGVTGSTEVKGNNNCVPAADCDFALPLINSSGAMLFGDVTSTAWLDGPSGMNASTYAGEATWVLPAVADLKALYQDLGLPSPAIASAASVGPFAHLQPFFYWACVPADPSGNQNGNPRSPCDFSAHAGKSSNGADMEWSFNFDTGFQATDLSSKQFFVMVYYPGT
jgi:hypothetical protein